MPVDSTHAEYAAALARWAKCRVAVDGEEAVHAAGAAYLPALSGQTPAEYAAYRGRATFFGASGRTLDGLVGLVFRRDPVIEVPAALDELVRDADLAGTPLEVIAQELVTEKLVAGRVGVLVDYPRIERTDAEPITVAQAQAAGIRPFLALYAAETIVNWRLGRVAGKTQVTRVVLKETYTVPKDAFEDETRPQYRVLELTPAGQYEVALWRERTDGEGRVVQQDLVPADQGRWVEVSRVVPLVQGRALNFIPFDVPGGWQVEKPPLLDLVNVNLSHYRGTADYEHGLHFTGLPTPVVTGYAPERKPDGTAAETFAIGSTQAWVFPDPQTKAFFLEFTGAGLSQLKESLERKEAQMVTLGARLIAPEKRQVEAAETAAIHRQGENSVLATVANACSLTLTRALQWAALWQGVQGECSLRLNTEFIAPALTAQEVTALVDALQKGAISPETFHDNLVRGEIIADGSSFEDEQARIQRAQAERDARALEQARKQAEIGGAKPPQ